MRNKLKLIRIIVLITVIGFTLATCDNSSNTESNNNNQTPVASDYTITNLDQTAGSVTEVIITAKIGKSSGTINNILYEGNLEIPQNVGNYPVTFDVAESSGWNAANNLSAGNLVVNNNVPADIPNPPKKWTFIDSPLSITHCIAYGNDTFVVGGRNNSLNGIMAYSTDKGKTWQMVSDGFFGSSGINCLVFGNNTFIAGCLDGKIFYSTDNGITWNNATDSTFSGGTYNAIYSIAYGNNTFVAGGYNGKMAYSTNNGKTWTAIESNPFESEGTSIMGIAYGNDTFVAVGRAGKTAYSNDNGKTWTLVVINIFGTDPDDSINGITYGNNTFVLVGEKYVYPYEDNSIAYSNDNGKTWTGTGERIYRISNVGFGCSTFVAISRNGAILCSIDDGKTWPLELYQNVFIYNNDIEYIYDIAYGNKTFVLIGENHWNKSYVGYSTVE